MGMYADTIIRALRAAGVQRLFGMPGGGCNADLIEAAERAGLPFTLAHTETASAFMAAAQAEITGRPGACIATLGPGAASIVNGIAHAHLDRVPLLVLTDCATPGMPHQALPQSEMFGPIVKFTARLDSMETLHRALEILATPPYGPVHLDVAPGVHLSGEYPRLSGSPPVATQRVASTLDFQRPVLLLGLGARDRETAEAVRRAGIPTLVTYKAKGVLPDRHPWFAGVLTNGALERCILEPADAFLTIGLDPVELLPRPWTYSQPMIPIAPADLASLGPAAWDQEEIAWLAAAQRERMRPESEGRELLPHQVVELTAEVYRGARVTVDAGAHMFPVMSLWPAEEPCGVLISNGLSTMGFALPAAIGAALAEPGQPVVAFTGDGGLMMCLGELRTAAREGLPLRIVLFDDGVLSLIRIKQQQRGYGTDSTGIGCIDWEAVGRGLGVETCVASTPAELRIQLRETEERPGPVLIAARISPRIYPDAIVALRGNG